MYNIVLVGRPNVGKSCLFNRLIRKKLSIVHDEPGITRDVLSHEVDDQFIVMDTGGISMFDRNMTPKCIKEAVEEQVEFTINASDLILFITDGLEGLHANDLLVADRLRSCNKKVLLVVNKIDTYKHDDLVHEFHQLGFGSPVSVSAEHGHGIDVLWKQIKESLGATDTEKETKEEKKVERIRISFVGRPNVGKSSLMNALLDGKKLIVSEVPGTTRDSVEIPLDYTAKNGEVIPFSLVDTAGLRAKSKVNTSVEYFSSLRTEGAVERSDIVFLVLDAREGVTKVDQKLAGDILKKGKGLIFVVNKWDLVFNAFKEDKIEGYKSINEFKKAFTDALNKEFFFHPNSPFLFVSAQDGYAIEQILKEAYLIHKKSNEKLPTGKLNRVIEAIMDKRNPSLSDGRRFKIYYVVHTNCNPFIIKIFCNQVTRLDEAYRRYLEDGVMNAFELKGIPVKFELVGKQPRERKEK